MSRDPSRERWPATLPAALDAVAALVDASSACPHPDAATCLSCRAREQRTARLATLIYRLSGAHR